jgi:hypothetical protein
MSLNFLQEVANDVPQKYKTEIAQANWTALDAKANDFLSSKPFGCNPESHAATALPQLNGILAQGMVLPQIVAMMTENQELLLEKVRSTISSKLTVTGIYFRWCRP